MTARERAEARRRAATVSRRSVADAVAREMRRRGIKSQAQLCQLAGVNRSVLSRLLAARASDPPVLRVLAALGLLSVEEA